MNIFEQEVIDGLAELLGRRSIAYCCVPQIDNSRLPSLTAKAAGKQPDLYYLDTILVSTAWNLNDDVFIVPEVWAARESPEDKPFNFEHNGDDIIGHITGNSVIDESGKVVLDDNPPSFFHIVTNAVLYRYWENEEKRKRAETIIAEIPEGKWFVSMECLYDHFDYALRDKQTGQERIISRNNSTAFLTKYLRAFGGDGVYQKYRIGRLLRGIVFCGKGLVRQPANPDSVILSAHAGEKFSAQKVEADFQETSTQNLTVYSRDVHSTEESMTEQEIAALKAKLEAKLEAQDSELKKTQAKLDLTCTQLQASQAEAVSLKSSLENSTKEVANLQKENTELKSLVSTAEKTVATLKASETELTGKLKTIEDKRLKEERMAKASKVFAGKEAEIFVESHKDFSDENFNTQLELVSATITQKSKPPVIEKKILDNVEPGKDASLATVTTDDAVNNFMKSAAAFWGKTEETK